jgi:hypothetical protein
MSRQLSMKIRQGALNALCASGSFYSNKLNLKSVVRCWEQSAGRAVSLVHRSVHLFFLTLLKLGLPNLLGWSAAALVIGTPFFVSSSLVTSDKDWP